ncbi:MAG: MurR/RpiR family transcriptional regulator, partial [Synergistaceae bacterium]|nr:MurR/RpiR family transcriptional regulator [Synergistaceae bacterium]
KKLGFENFSRLRRALQEEVSRADDGIRAEVPHEKIKRYENIPDKELLSAFSQDVLRNLRGDITAENDRKLIEATEMITNAERVFIVGFRSCYGFADTMAVRLSCVRPGVIVVGSSLPLVDTLIDLTDRDALIAISFARYSTDTAFAVRMASDAGCGVIAMTDSYAAPIAAYAAKTIISNSGSMSFFDSYVSLMLNVEKMLLLISKYNKKSNEQRLMKMEKYLSETGQY